MSEDAKPHGRWLRITFSLRTFLVLIGILCVSLAVVTTSANKQKRAVARLQEVMAIPRYDYAEEFSRQPPKLRWLRNLLGIHYFDTVILVFFVSNKAHENDLQIVQELPHVLMVNLEQSSLTGEGLVHLENLPNLKSIQIGGTNGTDAALECLSRMPQLEAISVGSIVPGGHVTDLGLAHLVRLPRLRQLYLSGRGITDAGLVHLQELTTLTQITIYEARVTDHGIAQLQEHLPKCKIRYGDRKRPTVVLPSATTPTGK